MAYIHRYLTIKKEFFVRCILLFIQWHLQLLPRAESSLIRDRKKVNVKQVNNQSKQSNVLVLCYLFRKHCLQFKLQYYKYSCPRSETFMVLQFSFGPRLLTKVLLIESFIALQLLLYSWEYFTKHFVSGSIAIHPAFQIRKVFFIVL